MNKTLLSAALIAGFGVAALAPQAARAVDGTVSITGTITAGTCVVGTGSPYTDAVVLPTVQTTALTGAVGTIAGSTPFSIGVTGCAVTAGHTLTTYFEPANANVDTTTHSLKNTGTATGVEVELLNGAGAASGGAALSQILLGNPAATQNSGSYTVSASGGATLNYYAQYYASAATVAAGSVSTSETFTMIYN
jgi:major type 1 subunit fimbrin (pilin)